MTELHFGMTYAGRRFLSILYFHSFLSWSKTRMHWQKLVAAEIDGKCLFTTKPLMRLIVRPLLNEVETQGDRLEMRHLVRVFCKVNLPSSHR